MMNATVVESVEPRAQSEAFEGRGSVLRIPVAPRVELEGPTERLRAVGETILGRIRQRPLMSIAAAVGVGFVVGGALTFRAGRLALAAAARHVARELMKQVL